MSNAVVTDWPSGSANTGWPGEPTAMLMPGRVEGWPAGTQRAANAAERLLSQATAWWDVGQYRNGDRFLRNRGTGGELLDLRLGSALAVNSNDPLFLPVEATGYVYLPGVAGNNLIVPDEAALDITGDIDIRAHVALDDWTPSAINYIVGKAFPAGQVSYRLQVTTGGSLALVWTTDGTTNLSSTSTAAVPAADGAAIWIRGTLDVDNGASGRDVTFYTSPDGVTWTQLGTTVTTAGTTSIYSGTSSLFVGVGQVAGQLMTGKVYRAQVLDGIDGTTVLDIDCDAITSGSATTFTALTGQTVTINRATSGRKSVAVPDRANRGASVMLLGTDDYLEVQDNWQHGLLNFGQGESFTVLAVVRQWATPASSATYLCKGVIAAGRYLLRTPTTTVGPILAVQDATPTAVNSTSQTGTSGSLSLFGGVVDRAASTVASVLNSTVSSTASIASVGSLANSEVLRVGRQSGTSTAYQDFEFVAAAIFRRALTPAEITALSNYFTGRMA